VSPPNMQNLNEQSVISEHMSNPLKLLVTSRDHISDSQAPSALSINHT